VEFTRRKKDRGALRIPAADGYHYADDHPWDGEDQVALITALDAIEQEFKRLEPKGFMPHKRHVISEWYQAQQGGTLGLGDNGVDVATDVLAYGRVGVPVGRAVKLASQRQSTPTRIAPARVSSTTGAPNPHRCSLVHAPSAGTVTHSAIEALMISAKTAPAYIPARLLEAILPARWSLPCPRVGIGRGRSALLPTLGTRAQPVSR